MPHAQKVERICRQLRERRSAHPVSLDLRSLDEVLHLDTARRVCVAEPCVPFSRLVATTMRYGLVPRVVPELRSLTIGEAVSGGSVESTSFRYGGFHDTCLEYEVVTARGEVLTCSPQSENALLFQMMHGSFGTLGILTKLTFALMPAKPYVHLRYDRFARLADFQAAIVGHVEHGDVSVMDGFIHSPAEYDLAIGDFTDEAPYVSSYDWLNVYSASTSKRHEDYLRIADYLFRYDQGNTNVGASRAASVDLLLPLSKWATFMEWYERELDLFPLWCVPYKLVHKYEWLSDALLAKAGGELFVDLAIYGMRERSDRNVYKLLEDEVLEVGGVKSLISYNSYSSGDFWRTWNRENYYTIKRRTDPNNVLRDIYTKTRASAPHGP